MIVLCMYVGRECRFLSRGQKSLQNHAGEGVVFGCLGEDMKSKESSRMQLAGVGFVGRGMRSGVLQGVIAPHTCSNKR